MIAAALERYRQQQQAPRMAGAAVAVVCRSGARFAGHIDAINAAQVRRACRLVPVIRDVDGACRLVTPSEIKPLTNK